jgi:hypothetical protein
MKSLIFLGILLLARLCTVKAQSSFLNLDFEQASIIPIPGSPYFPKAVYTTNALPEWTAYIGGVVDPVIHYDNVSLGAALVSIHDSGSLQPILEGNYTVLLQPSFPDGAVSAAIGQTAQVPSDSLSVRFFGSGAYNVTFAGQPIPLITLGTATNYTVFGGDISSFANQIGELRLTGFGLIDNIVFSPIALPEPGSLALIGLGAIFLCRKINKQKKKETG